MTTFKIYSKGGLLAAVLSLLVAPAASDAQDVAAPGTARISDVVQNDVVVRGQTPVSDVNYTVTPNDGCGVGCNNSCSDGCCSSSAGCGIACGSACGCGCNGCCSSDCKCGCQSGNGLFGWMRGSGCNDCCDCGCDCCGGIKGWFSKQSNCYRARNRAKSAELGSYLRCKFGYFLPTGCCGSGCPLIGKYHRIYAVDPNYFDSRDGNVFAAQGTGVPMAVPLAPTVHHAYNYGWGLPSSRVTPISRITPGPYYSVYGN